MHAGLFLESVQREIQLQHIDPGFPQNAELAAFDVLCDKLSNERLIQAPHLCDTADLIFSRCRTNVRV
jgi:hypothetical protein